MLLLVDLDGVVYRGQQPVPGVAPLLRRRADGGDRVIFVTNNSSRHRDDYRAHLEQLGLPADADSIVTAARATAVLLAGRDPRPRAVMVLGGPGLAHELRDEGLRVVPPTERGLAADADAVCVGVDFRLTYRRLSITAGTVRRGALFVATNRDPVYPAADGELLAGAGAMVAAVATAAGRQPDITVGKPEPRLFEAAAEIAGMPVAEAIVIGDNLFSDIAAARAVGARSILMLTGVTTPGMVATLPDAERPTAIARDAEELAARLRELAS